MLLYSHILLRWIVMFTNILYTYLLDKNFILFKVFFYILDPSVNSRTSDLQVSKNVSQEKKELNQLNQFRIYSNNTINSGVNIIEKCLSDQMTDIRETQNFNIPNPLRAKVDKATLIITNTSSESTQKRVNVNLLGHLCKRIAYLEQKVLHQDKVFWSYVPMSSEEEAINIQEQMDSKRSRKIYTQQYSHIPEISAFHRNTRLLQPLSPSKTTTIEKAHHSEQYGRDFTTYDGITTRKKQCASVPLKRDPVPKVAAERVHKIRHKLNPVRDYRLMDTVHYLAQGEFAPRDDGIKLTPSREAVLSDIIWEDVCRTHWPTTRLARRERQARYELQRLIDNLLREKVAHMERKRRKHYRIIKVNHRQENCDKALGKTGDIIVANHKGRNRKHNNDTGSDHSGKLVLTEAHRLPVYLKNRSEERIMRRSEKNPLTPLTSKFDDCMPGPSHIIPENVKHVYYPIINSQQNKKRPVPKYLNEVCNSNDFTMSRISSKNSKNKRKPRLVIKKEASRPKNHIKENLNLEHYILLPTLVVRTPSNVRRQKKFNELYHRILNTQLFPQS